MQYYNYKVHKTVDNTLREKYPNYNKGEIWTLLSYKLGSTTPPYYIQAIYNKDSNRFAFGQFEFNEKLELTSWQERKLLESEKTDHPLNKSQAYKDNITLFLAMEALEDNRPYSAILILQEHLDSNPTTKKISQLLEKTISSVRD